MEPMITISVKDYNRLVRSCSNKHAVELLKVIVDIVLEDSNKAILGNMYVNVVDTLQSIIRNLQSEEFSFEEIIERYKNDSPHESTEEDKEGHEIR